MARLSAISVAASSLFLAPLAPVYAADCSPTTSTVGLDTVLTFTTVGTCDWSVPAGVSTARVLIIGGGGGGGGDEGGGGGAGQFRDLSSQPVSGAIQVTVGAGGQGAGAFETDASFAALGGESSSFGALVAFGGGTGGAAVNDSEQDAKDGQGGDGYGSGGGGSGNESGYGPGDGGAAGTGFAGATPTYSSRGGGGGGAGGAGVDAGAGGAGATSNISGSDLTYAGGGGGGGGNSATGVASGGTGGAGSGGANSKAPTSASANSGSGGGGGGGVAGNGIAQFYGGNGGSGLVIVRFTTPVEPGTVQDFSAATRYVDNDTDSDSVTLNWTALTGQTPAVTGYSIQHSVNSDFSFPSAAIAVSGGSTTTATITGLDDGKTYYFQIKAVNDVGNSATAAETVSRAVSKEDFALDFDGSATVNGGNSIIPTADNAQFSVEAWVKPDSVTGYDTIVTQQTATSSNYFYLGLYQTGTSYYVDVGRDTSDSLLWEIPNPTGKWMHIAVTVATNDDIELFVDGTLRETFNKGNAGTGPNFAIGSYVDGTYPFDGQIDQVKIWNDVRTPSEIVASMHAWGNPASGDDTSLISHYDFNDSTQAAVLRDMARANDLDYTSATTEDLMPLVERDTDTRSGYAQYKFIRSYLTEVGGWQPPAGVTALETLVVGGGGGGGGTGGREFSGGGGGGGEAKEENVTPDGSAYQVTVGLGGKGGSATARANPEDRPQNGQSSIFGSVTVSGGGSGGHAIVSNWTSDDPSAPGPGGGGGAQFSSQTGSPLNSFSGGDGVGSSTVVNNQAAGGGAGANGNGGAASSGSAGAGGQGLVSSISGTTATYGGGGGGGKRIGESGEASGGGAGGGGAGGRSAPGADGVDNLGGGGGGAGGSDNGGGEGGSGAVVIAFAITNTVTFNPNGGTGSATTQSIVSDQATALTANSFTRTGYTFAGWNTDADGTSGTDYTDQQSVTITGALTLYAKWTADTYTISFNANSATGGTVPASQTKTHDTDLTLASNSGSLVRTGYTFAGWNTGADGLGTTYAAGATYSVEAADELFAKWEPLANRYAEITSSKPGSGSATGKAFKYAGQVLPADRTSWSIETWFFEKTHSSNQNPIISQGLDSGSSFTAMVITRDSRRELAIIDGEWIYTSVALPQGQWHHFAYTFDNGSYSVYINGKLAAAGTVSGGTNSGNFLVGENAYYQNGDPRHVFYGYVDQVKIWSDPLTQANVQTSMHARGDAGISNLEHHYSFDNSSNPGQDEVGSKNLSVNGTGAEISYASFPLEISTPTTGLSGTSGTSYSLPSFSPGGTGQKVFTVSSGTLPAGLSINSASGLISGTPTAAGSQTVQVTVTDSTTSATTSSFTIAVAANTYTITFNSGDDGAGSDQTATKTDGTDLTLPNSATANSYFTRTGYAVTGWSENADGSTNDYALGASYTTDAADTLYPVWTLNTYTITFNRGFLTGSTGADQTTAKSHGVALALPDSETANTYFTKTGYTVTGWSLSGDGSTADFALGANFTANEADFVFPIWTPNAYTITFNKGTVSGATGTDQTATKTHDQNLALPNSSTANGYFTKTGYTVTGWSTSADGSTSDFVLGASYTTEEADTLYPVWTADTYTVTYSYDSATSGNSTASSDYTVDGIVISLPTPLKTGFTFAGWYSESGLSTLVGLAGASYSPSADITLYAKWSAATFTVIFDYNEATGGNGTASDTFTTGNTAITLPTPTRTGYTFGGWYSDAGLATSVGAGGASYSPTSNLTIYAKWTGITRNVNYNDTNSTGGSVPTDSTDYIIGDSVVVKANSGLLARTGYTFAGWVTNSDGTGTAKNAGETITVATVDIELYPKWTANTYTITYNRNAATGGLLAKATDTYTTGALSGTTLAGGGTMTKTGYSFNGWSTTTTGTIPLGAFTTTADVTVYAIWSPVDYDFDYDLNTGSGTAPTTQSANITETVTISGIGSTTKTGHWFGGWNTASDGSGSTYAAGATASIPVDGATLYAIWVPDQYRISYNANGGTGGPDLSATDGFDTATFGVAYTLRAINDLARTGYTFSHWSLNAGGTGDKYDLAQNSLDELTQYTPTANTTFYAQWTAVSYSHTFDVAGGSASLGTYGRTLGQSLSMPSAGTRTGYVFDSWTDGTNDYAIGSTYTVTAANKSFTAQWIPNVYTVTYDWSGGASDTPDTSDNYTVGTGPMDLPTATGSGYSRDGYTFSGWSTTPGGTLVSDFEPTADDVLYAVWADGNYTLTYVPKGGTVGSGLGTVGRGSAVTLPTPVRANFRFTGWYDSASGGVKIGNGGDSFTPGNSRSLHARWVQNSLFGVDEATLESGSTYTASDSTGTDATLTHTPSGTSARVQIPAGALDAGTVVNVRYFKETERQSGLIEADNSYFFALLVSWLKGSGDTATVPTTAAGKPITVTLNNTAIKAGAMVYQVIGDTVTELGRASVDGSVTVELTEDPEIVVAATAPSAPTSVAGVAGDTTATVSWTAGSSGGAEITSYTVTASPGGATCTTATTSCVVSGLTNNTSYTFSVTATNAIGTSAASGASSAVTPVGASYVVTFDSNGGSSVSAGSFFSGGSVNAPTNPTRSGYNFVGWSTTLDDENTKVSFPYSPGVLTAITLYALWSPAPASPSNVVAPPLVVPSLENYSWTKRMDNGTAKIYSKNVVGVGKIQFYLNGREIAWIRAEDEYDRKLRTANGFYYLVRTVYLSRGKNILEIYVNGQRVRRVAYANK